MAARRPHIILIDTDQQRADTIHCNDAPWMVTPNLDQLAADGVLFSSAFTCAATCVSSRAAFYSGLYPHNTGIYGFDEYTGAQNWTHRLRGAGYRCATIGKTHISGPNHGYDERIGDQGNKCSPSFIDANGNEPSLWLQELKENGLEPPLNLHNEIPNFFDLLGAVEWTLPERFHPDFWVADKAVQWIDTASFEEPAFLHIGFMGPHDLYDPIPRYLDLYDDDDIPMPSVTDEQRAQISDEFFATLRGYEEGESLTTIKASHATPERIRRMRKHYFANVTMLDEMVGRVVASLEARAILDETIIIFTSDHGDHLFDHGLVYEGELYDTVVNVPLIVRAPEAISPGRTSTDLVSQLDVAQYILESAGVQADDLDGVSLGPVVTDGAKHSRQFVFAEEGKTGLRCEPDVIAMIRSERYKLVYLMGGQAGQLFDLQDDPAETNNLWADHRSRDLRSELTAGLLDWLYTNQYKHKDLFANHR